MEKFTVCRKLDNGDLTDEISIDEECSNYSEAAEEYARNHYDNEGHDDEIELVIKHAFTGVTRYATVSIATRDKLRRFLDSQSTRGQEAMITKEQLDALDQQDSERRKQHVVQLRSDAMKALWEASGCLRSIAVFEGPDSPRTHFVNRTVLAIQALISDLQKDVRDQSEDLL